MASVSITLPVSNVLDELIPGNIYLINNQFYLLVEDSLCVDSSGIHKRYTLYSVLTGKRLFGSCYSIQQLRKFIDGVENS